MRPLSHSWLLPVRPCMSTPGQDIRTAVTARLQNIPLQAGDSCDGIRISPNTGSSTEEGTPPDAGGAYSIDAGEVVNLSSQTSGREDYLSGVRRELCSVYDRKSDRCVAGKRMEDRGVSGGYTYFQNGSRWYRVSSDEVTVYDEADGAVIRNEESDAQPVYVYAVNLMEDMEPGAVTTYVYNVNSAAAGFRAGSGPVYLLSARRRRSGTDGDRYGSLSFVLPARRRERSCIIPSATAQGCLIRRMIRAQESLWKALTARHLQYV